MTRMRSNPEASEAPINFVNKCRLASQVSTGRSFASARNPATSSRIENPMINAEPIFNSARRAISAAALFGPASVSVISMTRR